MGLLVVLIITIPLARALGSWLATRRRPRRASGGVRPARRRGHPALVGPRPAAVWRCSTPSSASAHDWPNRSTTGRCSDWWSSGRTSPRAPIPTSSPASRRRPRRDARDHLRLPSGDGPRAGLRGVATGLDRALPRRPVGRPDGHDRGRRRLARPHRAAAGRAGAAGQRGQARGSQHDRRVGARPRTAASSSRSATTASASTPPTPAAPSGPATSASPWSAAASRTPAAGSRSRRAPTAGRVRASSCRRADGAS